MTQPVYLLMAMHAHQPVGNFDSVMAQASRTAYEPFIDLLERHPGVRVSLHYSGSLLDWLLTHRPAFIKRVSRLVKQGQVELLASGYYEPILPVIPEADRQGQIRLMRETLKREFGAAASGAWLTERVWEPDLPQTLAKAGIAYTMLDANQFRVAQSVLPRECQVDDQDGWDVTGSYMTGYEESSVRLFPASRRLRYWIPFQDVERTIGFLKGLQRDAPVAVTYADDAEKFGLWPKTYAWVYEQGWLERFFTALERESGWLKTATFHDYASTVQANGRVYLPFGSYDEMLEWSGGSFRNFFVKYPESNAIWRKMLGVSRQLQEVSSLKFHVSSSKKKGRNSKPATRNLKLLTEARRALYQAQCNDAYWHGVFGGLYLSHLRRALYQRLIRAERLIEQGTGRLVRRETRDVDGDGQAELILRNERLSVVVDPEENGSVAEVDHRPSGANLIDTLTRRYERYHEKLKTQPVSVAAAPDGPASIHDLLQVKERGLEAFLVYDDHRRTGFHDYGLSKMPSLTEIVRSTWNEHRLWSPGAWQVEQARARRASRSGTGVWLRRALPAGSLRKGITLAEEPERLAFRYELAGVKAPVVALEWNLGLADERWRRPTWLDRVEELDIADPHLGVGVTMTATPGASAALFPIETVSESEEGLERTYQGLAVVWIWPVHGAATWACDVTWRTRTVAGA